MLTQPTTQNASAAEDKSAQVDWTDWKPVPHHPNTYVRQIGWLTLNVSAVFTQYHPHAADTDYVSCQPQRVPLVQYDDYWVCAAFTGVISASTIPQHKTGSPAKACLQTQAWGGIGTWMLENDLYSLEITHPNFEVRQVAQYSSGQPMMALRKKGEAK